MCVFMYVCVFKMLSFGRYLYVRQKAALGHKWVLMYCVIETEWLKCLVSDNELLELEHLPTTTVKPVGVEVITYIRT